MPEFGDDSVERLEFGDLVFGFCFWMFRKMAGP